MVIRMKRPTTNSQSPNAPPPQVPPTGRRTVSQKELEDILFLRGRIRMLTQIYNAKCVEVIDLIRDGAVIEAGRRDADTELEQAGPDYTVRLNVF